MGKRGPKPGTGGVPEKPVDFKILESLCIVQCTEQEIADHFDMSIQTLNEKIKAETGKTFLEYYAQKKGTGRMSLRRTQWRTAIGTDDAPPNVTMQIWLGKQMLGQKDKQEIEHSGGVTINIGKEFDGV